MPDPSAAALAALAGAAPPLALLDAAGRLAWCSEAFAQLLAPARALPEAALAALLRGEAVELPPPGDGWRLHLAPADPAGALRVLSAEPLAALRAERERADRLQERLELVQQFTHSGIFERDPRSMRGSWDAQMYRIWGLPPAAPGEASPPYATTTALILPDDRRTGAFAATLSSPGPHAQRVRIRRPDGQLRHLHTQWKVFHDAAGNPVRVLGINTDDTDVFELANRAEQLRTELQVALELGHIALWRYDLASERLTLDELGCQVIGVPWRPDGFTLEEARARIHPDDRPQADASARLTLRTGEPTDMQLRYPHPDGGWKHVLLRRALQRDADGQPLGFVGVLLDVTAQVEDNRRALDAARRLEAAAEAARVGLWTTERGSPLPRWNARMYRLFGLDPGAGPLPLQDWLARCVHGADRARVDNAVRHWWRNGNGPLELEFRVQRPVDGDVRWVVVRGQITRDGEGQVRRAEGVALDITEQQETLRRLRQTVERMTLSAGALGLGHWEYDIATQQPTWDTQMFRLRGVDSPPRPVSLQELRSFVHPDDRARVVHDQAERLASGQPWQHEFRVCWPDGRVRWITSHSVVLLDEQGRPERRIGVNWDSTEAHAAAEAQRERQRVVAESQAKSAAMSRISHELRTPLNAVLGFTQLLRSAGGETPADRERRARWLAHIDDAGRHLLALIDDVLELSRAEAGGVRSELQVLGCAAFVDATLPLVAGDAQARQVTLQRGPLPGAVLADAVRLRQVLINLLTNAIKFNRSGGEVRVSSERRGAQVALQVADTGIGIAPEKLADAFEPFNRAGAEGSGVEGSGIGLAIVKVLVEQMGGQVQVTSRPGQGSVFTVLLAAAPDDAAPPPGAPDAAPTAAAPPQARAASLLYIEDNPVNAQLVAELLATRPGVALHIARDGHSGITLAQRLQPDLILVDLQLPDIDGHAVLRALQADPRTAGIRCVVLSANATPADREAALAAGFVDYWTKPIEFGAFLDGLGSLLGRQL